MSTEMVESKPFKSEMVQVLPPLDLARSEHEIQVDTAKKYPRNMHDVIATARKLCCGTEKHAEMMFYMLPRGGKDIVGPTIRFFETMQYCMGNIRVATRIVDLGETTITVQAVAMDMQNNTSVQTEVQRKIVKRNGDRFDLDMIVMTGNAGMSIARRNAIKSLIPRPVWEPIFDEALAVAVGTEKTLTDRRSKTLDWFVKQGVSNEKIFNRLGVKGIEDIGIDELTKLKAIYSGVKNEEYTLEEAFSEVEPDKGSKAKVSALSKVIAAQGPAELLEKLSKCTTAEEVNKICKAHADQHSKTPADMDAVFQIGADRIEQLKAANG